MATRLFLQHQREKEALLLKLWSSHLADHGVIIVVVKVLKIIVVHVVIVIVHGCRARSFRRRLLALVGRVGLLVLILELPRVLVRSFRDMATYFMQDVFEITLQACNR